jgi:hypothetical protein
MSVAEHAFGDMCDDWCSVQGNSEDGTLSPIWPTPWAHRQLRLGKMVLVEVVVHTVVRVVERP